MVGAVLIVQEEREQGSEGARHGQGTIDAHCSYQELADFLK